ncbi:MAG: VOC family protein [Planctomycetaceae bacterium]|nr:VOC family protein [Planctomycetaceae bacterium]
MKDGELVQVAHLVRDLDAALEKYWRDFGMGPWDLYTYDEKNLQDSIYRGNPSDHTYRIAVCWQNGVQMEVMQPVSGYSIYDEFLEKHGEGLHHIKLFYNDCDKAVREYESKGYAVIQSGRVGDDVFYYLDSEAKVAGAVLELGNAGTIPPPEARYPKQ